MAALKNIVRVYTPTVGAGVLTLGAAVQGYKTFIQAGCVNGETYTYGIHDFDAAGNLIASEVGRGTYNAIFNTFTRTSVLASTNADAALVLSGNAHVFITAIAEDFAYINQLTGDVTAGPGSGSVATSITNKAVTLAKMQDFTAYTVLANDSGVNATPQLVPFGTMMKINDAPSDGKYYARKDATWAEVVIPSAGITQLTGDVTAGPGSGSVAATIAAEAVTLGKMAKLAANSIIGNNTAAPAVPVALTAAQVLAMAGLVTSITAGKTLTLAAANDYTLTVPATGTTALLGIANLFTAAQTINVNSATALLVERSGVKNNVLVVDTTNGIVSVNGTGSSTFQVNSPSGGANTCVSLKQLGNNQNTSSSYISIDFNVPTTNLVGQFFATASNYSNPNVNLAANSCGFISEATGGQMLLGATGTNGYMSFNTGGYAASNERMRINNAGLVTVGSSGISGSGRFNVVGTSDIIQTIIQGFSSQTANLTEWQNSSRTALAYVEPDGEVVIPQDSKGFWVGGGKDMTMYYDGTSGYVSVAAVAPSDLHVVTGAAKTLVLDTPVYDDIQFPISSGRIPVANAPTWEQFGTLTNMSAYAFSVDDFIDLQCDEPPHGWNEGTNGTVHVHFALKTVQSSGANRYAKFTVWVAISDVDGVWTEIGPYTSEKTIPTGTAALTHYLLDVGTATLAGYHLGSQIKVRVKRIAATTGIEYADDVYITQVGMHVEKVRLGSRSVSSA